MAGQSGKAGGGAKALDKTLEADAKGPDNNKRLAALELGVSALALALAGANLMPEDSAEDPLDVAAREIERLGRIDLDHASLSAFLLEKGVEPLEGERAVHTAIRLLGVVAQDLEAAAGANVEYREKLEATLAERDRASEESKTAAIAVSSLAALLAGDMDLAPLSEDETPAQYATRLADALRERCSEPPADQAGNEDPADQVAGLEEKVRALTATVAELDATIAAFDQAKARRPRKGAKPAELRACGPIATDEDVLAAALASGEELELVFADGAGEIAEFDPVRVFPAAFDRQGGMRRIVLREAVLLKAGSREQTVHGVALFQGAEQIAWCEFPSPVAVVPGTERKFDRMIVFG